MSKWGCVAALALATAWTACQGADAKIVRFEISKTEPYGDFRPGAFVRMEGRVTGELAPSERIPGLDKAPKNARGNVEYATPFVIIAPRQPGAGNGALVFDVANRGRPITHSLYNSPQQKFLPVGSLDAGTGFLQERGFTVVMAAWELGEKIELPHFVGDDGKTHYVEGAGVAAIRDIVDFLHNAARDESGTPNPLAGRINRTLGVGYSQTARLLKTMLIQGFNDADGRRVFDGLHLHGSAGGLATILTTGTGPQSSTFMTPRFTAIDLRGVHEEPFTYQDIVGRATARGEVPPKMLVTNTTTDYFSIRASLARNGAHGTAEAPIPGNVRIYDIAGASHGRSSEPGCEIQRAVLDWSPVMRATLVNLDQWVSRNREPPATTLMPLAPRPTDEGLLPKPAHLPNAIIQAPQEDADGNFIGGVVLPDVAVPLGTHGAQNRPLSDRSCNLTGAYIAFAATPEARASGDKRLAISERYKGRADYLNRIRSASRALVEQRFLLRDDAAAIVQAAAVSPAFGR